MSTMTIEQEQLVKDNTGLVHYIAKRYYCPNMDHADLVQVGMIGLIKAGKTFDVNRGCKFNTLAGVCIKGEITKLFRKKRIQAVSLNMLLPNDESENEYINLIEGDINPPSEVHLKIDLQKALSKLDELERFVVEHNFGIKTGECLTQTQIAKMIDCSQVHVGRLIKNALEKMRRELEGVYFL